MFQDRRQYARLAPNTPQLVLLDESKYSLLFDVCEGGLAIEGYAAQKQMEQFALEFDLPAGSGSIQAKAEVVWTSDAGYRTGFRFVDLADSHRQQLRTWIADARAALRPTSDEHAAPATENDDVERDTVVTNEKHELQTGASPLAVALPTWSAPTVQTSPFEYEYENEPVESRIRAHGPGVLLASAVCLVAFLMGYYWRSANSRPHPPQVAAAAGPPKAPVNAAASVRGAAVSSPNAPVIMPTASEAAPSGPAFSEPGFVLQVGAMASEANADALSTALQSKNFSAFVFRRGSDHLHRVVVGPFETQESAVKTQHDLEAQGFKSLLKPWSPE